MGSCLNTDKTLSAHACGHQRSGMELSNPLADTLKAASVVYFNRGQGEKSELASRSNAIGGSPMNSSFTWCSAIKKTQQGQHAPK